MRSDWGCNLRRECGNCLTAIFGNLQKINNQDRNGLYFDSFPNYQLKDEDEF